MATTEIDVLVAAGHRWLRLPFWNEDAYLMPDVLEDGTVGPWSSLYDVGCGVGGGEPIRMLTDEAAQSRGWVPAVLSPEETQPDA